MNPTRVVVVLGGEQEPNAALIECSTTPTGVARQAHDYLAQGGATNLASLHAFLSDTLLLTGEGFDPPVTTPSWGVLERPEAPTPEGPRVGVLFYRAQYVADNVAYVHALADAIRKDTVVSSYLVGSIADASLPEPPDVVLALHACDTATDEALARAVEDNHATGDKVEVFDIDMRMHRAIVAAGHNAALSRSYGEYLARLWRIRFLSARRRSDAAQVLAAHRGMVDALAARDWPAMRAHMESHLDGLVRNLDAHFSDDDAEA